MPLPDFDKERIPQPNFEMMEKDLLTMSIEDLRDTLRVCVHALTKLGQERDDLYDESQKTGLLLSALVNRSADKSVTIEDSEIERLIITSNGKKTIAGLRIEEDDELKAVILRLNLFPKNIFQ